MSAFMTFDQAITDSKAFSKRHLLLGNGFSIACKPNIFQYGSLFDRADFGSMHEAKNAFSVLGTKDFEFVIHALENASRLFPVYYPDFKNMPQKIRGHATAIKDILVKTIAHNQPEGPFDAASANVWGHKK